MLELCFFVFSADPIVLEDATFSWGGEDGTVLRDVNLRIKKGSLVAVVGAVGTAKSSLLSAMLGEMDKISGRVNTQVIFQLYVYDSLGS